MAEGFHSHSVSGRRRVRSSDFRSQSGVPMGSVKTAPASSTETSIPDSQSFAFMSATQRGPKEGAGQTVAVLARPRNMSALASATLRIGERIVFASPIALGLRTRCRHACHIAVKGHSCTFPFDHPYTRSGVSQH
jgi:hypothetical protein